MNKIIQFYKEQDSLWYADLPDFIEAGGDKEMCQMVAGADLWLDFISNNGCEITLEISDEMGTNRLIMEGILGDEDGGGAIYLAHEYNEEPVGTPMWLCPVTLFVFGKYPKIIYYSVVK